MLMRQIPSSMLEQAWYNSGGFCQRCGSRLVWGRRGVKGGWGRWVVHSVSGLQKPSLADYKILCWGCHRREVVNRLHAFEQQFCDPSKTVDLLHRHEVVQRSTRQTNHMSMEQK